MPQEFSLPGLPRVTSLRNLIPIVTLITKAICSLHWLPCIPWQMITMLFSSTMSNDSYDKGGRACNDSLLTVRTLYHYASNLLKGAPQEFSLPGLPGVTSLQNVNEMVNIASHKFINVNVRNRSTISPIGNLLKGVPQQFSLPGLPSVTRFEI